MKNKKNKKKTEVIIPPPHNPADSADDHSEKTSAEEEYKNSYLIKQEAEGVREIDNEDTVNDSPESAEET